MKLLCDYCGRDLNEIWQCNMSPEPFIVICEDCSGNKINNKEYPMSEHEYE
ncbi:hypothetical protein UFOVP855_33 [uncultured Caudovirales phage]|uniref:Uncharacterized protein n=1 Tax=uncultured Caudovirales phage TaxID=2100421 RepID=A0A6J5PCJ1_9CAUD|nr:hypothetical protein UFOVP527_10 [uncultured Caudovirales phage]CAB4167616.1 hypothetical protein UFOVP855_33 [uncultured Caudovirales phage]CAB4173600.1 hypothetical protein UFOVP954_41 [uncultured Caudovirales phage]CAB4178993.1 hypothetical protein UFOVP1026_20 [uncultured Caudovirales phage]CAB4188250.1 hypothetical protein UFOVP1180_4 [uncultured Caudovirales phage]